MVRKRIVIIGAGGLAREVEWLLRDINQVTQEWEFAGYVVSDLSKLGSMDAKEQVVGDFSIFDTLGAEAAVIGIGTPSSRLKVARELSSRFPKLQWPTLTHPSAKLDLASAHVGPGVVLTAGVIATVGVRLGAYCFVNLACTIGHEAELGPGCVLNPTVNISGGVKLGEGVLVGTGAQILQYLEVGAGAIVGAGAVVTKNVEAGTTVVGAPARPRS